ncbi:hypothetical protein MtrunA17_Chr1g0151911 [Medicago truncatula]|uniref:Uncharacterized protein n=1 Tax=Medicago truncatula TaxID=3880 RepID=I3SUP7_MEDTR|nr:unknown [Medicago truncatula]RHN77174.1 hypothetical protein MtrunA17_Chr1g0151911 [Medicago truncatula]
MRVLFPYLHLLDTMKNQIKNKNLSYQMNCFISLVWAGPIFELEDAVPAFSHCYFVPFVVYVKHINRLLQIENILFVSF